MVHNPSNRNALELTIEQVFFLRLMLHDFFNTTHASNGRKYQVEFNPFPAKRFPIDEYNRLALDRVKSISALSAQSAVNWLTAKFNLKK